MTCLQQYSFIVFCCIIHLTYQTSYTCDPNAPCGCSKDTVTVSRIVGGEDASTAAWGWTVSLKIGGGGLCGGSIISDSWVLTAAHCTASELASDFVVYAGSNTRWNGTQVRNVSKIVQHPRYNAATFENDISLLKLSSPLNMNDPYVSMICLPSVSQTILSAGEWPPVGTNLVAAGWGRNSSSGSLPLALQQVTVQAVAYDDSTCTAVMVDWHVQFCAGVSGGGKDTCQGDSGGPLMLFNGSNLWVLVGATSSGIGCALPTDAGMYTRVASFVDWIKASISPLSTTTQAQKSTTTFTLSPASTIVMSVSQVLSFVAITFIAASFN